MIDWEAFTQKLRAWGPTTSVLNSRCSQARINEEELRLGQMPGELSQMLRTFNGGELFIDVMPMITLFGLSQNGDPPSSDWYIDRYTPKWRAAKNRPFDWVIGMTNYGGVIIMDQNSYITEWDTSQHKWSTGKDAFSTWLERTIAECAEDIN